jgi:hypothetical protein
MERYRYNVRNKNGVQEIYTGTFKGIIEAQEWYERYGTYFVSLGRELLLIKLNDNEKDNE